MIYNFRTAWNDGSLLARPTSHAKRSEWELNILFFYFLFLLPLLHTLDGSCSRVMHTAIWKAGPASVWSVDRLVTWGGNTFPAARKSKRLKDLWEIQDGSVFRSPCVTQLTANRRRCLNVSVMFLFFLFLTTLNWFLFVSPVPLQLVFISIQRIQFFVRVMTLFHELLLVSCFSFIHSN